MSAVSSMIALINRRRILFFLAVLSVLSCRKELTDLWAGAGMNCEESIEEINLAAGKFYKFSVAPSVDFPDRWPCTPWSDGSKLTDEETGTIKTKALGVGWRNIDNVSITVDLGQNRTIFKVGVHTILDNVWKIGAPAEIEIYASKDGITWTNLGLMTFAHKSDAVEADASSSFERVSGRYVKFVVKAPTSPSTTVLLDEIRVFGDYETDYKYVPSKGCYHGAFNNSISFSKLGVTRNFITEYEKTVGKQLSMMLWYQQLDPDHPFSQIVTTMEKYTSENLGDDRRFLMYGWLPDKYKASQLASGVLDEHMKQYFTDVAEYQVSENNRGPVWFRPANEMNGSWTNYSGDPVSYVRFWRRMYNIAEQIGVSDYNVFVWAVSDVTYNSASQIKKDAEMIDYYPGDQYVDWIGASVYYHNVETGYVNSLLKEVEMMSKNKPMMIAEGAFRLQDETCDGQRWIREWFGVKETHPNVRAIVWFNLRAETEGNIYVDKDCLDLYKNLVQDDYWLARIPDDVKEEIEIRKSRQKKVDLQPVL